MIDTIRKQMLATRQFTLHLLSGIPQDAWFTKPNDIHTHIAWQVGHLSISEYFNGVVSIHGSQPEVKPWFPIREFAIGYGAKSQATTAEESQHDPAILLEKLELMRNYTLSKLDEVTPEDLALPIQVDHPLCNTREEALWWNIRHESWHQGQIALVARLLGHPARFSRP